MSYKEKRQGMRCNHDDNVIKACWRRQEEELRREWRELLVFNALVTYTVISGR